MITSNVSTGTSEYKILVEQAGLALIEIYGEFYVVSIDRNNKEVRSIIPADRPKTSQQRFAALNTSGIISVASPLSMRTAKQHFKKLVDERLFFSGEKA